MIPGLKSGLEIHFQLDTKTKLFCNCDTTMSEKPINTVKRRLHPVAGELGDVDPAAVYEFLKDKEYVYQQFDQTSCLVENDEEPPHDVNSEALEIALQVAKMLHCEIPKEIHFMRKTVIDGSNTSGFQRTALIGINGWIKTSFGKVGITNVQLEEDAAAIVSKKGKTSTYRLDRLGVPLIEIATTPDCTSPQQVRELAEKLGMIMRSTGKSKAQLGSIRQDVNVSVPKGARVEIKGVQTLKGVEKAVELEALRQKKLLNQGKKIAGETRKLNEDFTSSFLRPMPGKARMYPETDVKPILTTPILSRIKIPELIETKIKKLSKRYNIPQDIVNQLIYSPHFQLFERYATLNPKFIASVLTQYTKEMERIGEITGEQVEHILKMFKKKKISKDGVYDLMKHIAKRGVSVEKAIEKVVGRADLDEIVDKVIKQRTKLIKEQGEKAIKPLMGLVMKELRGKYSGEKIYKKLQKRIKEMLK